MTKRTGRRRGHPGVKPGERTIRLRVKIPESTMARIDARAGEMGLARSTWVRLVVENALCKVPAVRSPDAVWLGEQLGEDRPPLIADVNRAARRSTIYRGPPRVLP